MNKLIGRRDLLGASLAFGAALLVPRARACEVVVGGFKVMHSWTRATPAEATTAILCMQFTEVTESDRLIGVVTPVATGAQMAGIAAGPVVDFEIPAGVASELSEQGTYVLLTGLQQPLAVGRQYPLRLEFATAGAVLATLNVDFA
jgi:hypothetical protein